MPRVVAIIVMCMAVNIYVPVAPSLLGALVDYQGLDVDVAGRLISYNFLGAAAANVVALFVLHRPGWNLRATMAGCLLLVVATSVASVAFAGNLPALAAVRFANGLAAGLGFTVSCVAVIGTPRIERIFAVIYGSPFLISGIGLALLPQVYEAAGIEGAFYGMGLLNLLCLALLPLFPRFVDRGAGAASAAGTAGAAGGIAPTLRPLAGLVIAAVLLHYFFNSGLWTYFERLGVAAGMTPERAGAILGPGMSAAIVGMVAASLLGDRFGYMKPIYLSIVTITASTLLLLGASSEVAFGVATAVFNASITFATPYMISILALLIPSGLGVSAANFATIVGFSAGPLVISFLVGGGHFTAPILVTAAGFVVVAALFALFVRRLDRHPELGRLRSLCRGWAAAREANLDIGTAGG